MSLSLSLFFVFACNPDKSSDTGDVDDTGLTEDTAVDSGDSEEDTGEDTGENSDPFALDFAFDGESTGAKMALVVFNYGGWSEGSDFEVFGEQVAVAPIIDSAPSFLIDEPTTLDDMEEGGQGQFYMSFIFEDDNENGQHEENEAILGVAEKLIAYLKDSAMADDGWYTLDMPDFTSEEPVDLNSFAPYSTVDLSANLLSNDEMTLSGESGFTDAGLRLALVSMVELETATNLEDVGDTGLDTTWSLTLDGAPGDSQYVMIADGPPYWIAPQMPMVYSDENGNELKDGGEFPIGFLCHNDSIVRVTHYSYPHTFPAAMAYISYGFGPGWKVAYEGESESPTGLMLDESELSELTVGPNCVSE